MIEFMGVANIFYVYPNFRIILVAKGGFGSRGWTVVMIILTAVTDLDTALVACARINTLWPSIQGNVSETLSHIRT